MVSLVVRSPGPVIAGRNGRKRQRSGGRRRRCPQWRSPVEEFVDAVRPHRFLYDRTQLDFKDVSKKEALWEIIGQQFGLSGHKAMNKWRNIRDKYYKFASRRRGQTWTLFPKLDQILDSGGGTEGADTSGEGSSQAGVSPACGTFVSSSWVQANVDHVSFTSGLASLEAMLQDESGGPIPQVKQEPPEPLEMIISEEQDATSCHEDAVDSEREDEIAMEAIEHSIAIAKQVFQRYTPHATRLDLSPTGVDGLREIVRDIVREELRKLLPTDNQPAALSTAEVVREEVQRAFQPEAPASVAAPEEPTLTYAAVARRPAPAYRQYWTPPRRDPPAPQTFQRRDGQPQLVRTEQPAPRKTDVWRTADRRPLCYHCGEADHVYRRGPIPQVKQEPPEPLEMIISEEQDATYA
ncbi:hypothetical protein HPB47_012931 [Ixodes persulcatus]|uniref:Uncharacterized protein n=1 Tax=Ixodes persulcatus TaxID=34615 RepID=A0AC60NS50_IXOPE|nr:hypothetical protein HPB47_012931 [Ixodes persulcatus]